MGITFQQSNVRLLYRRTSKRRVSDVPPLLRPASLFFGTSLNSSTEVSISQRTYSVNTPEERSTKSVLGTCCTVIHSVAPKQTRLSYLSGRSTTTREPAPICVPFPIVMFPSRHAPAPISTPFPIWIDSAAFFCFQSQVFTAMDGICMVHAQNDGRRHVRRAGGTRHRSGREKKRWSSAQKQRSACMQRRWVGGVSSPGPRNKNANRRKS